MVTCFQWRIGIQDCAICQSGCFTVVPLSLIMSTLLLSIDEGLYSIDVEGRFIPFLHCNKLVFTINRQPLMTKQQQPLLVHPLTKCKLVGEQTFKQVYSRNSGRVPQHLSTFLPKLHDWIITNVYGSCFDS